MGKNLSNFVPPAWKLDNPYYHTDDNIEYPDDDTEYEDDKEYEDVISGILDQVANPVREQFDTPDTDPITGTSSSFFPEYEDISWRDSHITCIACIVYMYTNILVETTSYLFTKYTSFAYIPLGIVFYS